MRLRELRPGNVGWSGLRRRHGEGGLLDGPVPGLSRGADPGAQATELLPVRAYRPEHQGLLERPLRGLPGGSASGLDTAELLQMRAGLIARGCTMKP